MKRLTCVAVFALFSASVHAQPAIVTAPKAAPPGPSVATPSAPAPTQSQPHGAYCETGFDAIGQFGMARNQAAAPDASIVHRNCAPGDTIMIESGYSSLIAKVCDFS